MQITFTVDLETLTPLIESVVRTVLAEKPVTVEAVVEDEVTSEDPPPTETTMSEAPPPTETTMSEAPTTASLPEDFNILLHAKAWVEEGNDGAARRKWLKDQLDSIQVKSLTALTDEQLVTFTEAMKNAAV